MERFVINPKVICSDGLAPDDDPARRSSDVGSDACIIQNPIPTVVSVRTVVTKKWMDRFVLGLVEYPSVSRTKTLYQVYDKPVHPIFCNFWSYGYHCRHRVLNHASVTADVRISTLRIVIGQYHDKSLHPLF